MVLYFAQRFLLWIVLSIKQNQDCNFRYKTNGKIRVHRLKKLSLRKINPTRPTGWSVVLLVMSRKSYSQVVRPILFCCRVSLLLVTLLTLECSPLWRDHPRAPSSRRPSRGPRTLCWPPARSRSGGPWPGASGSPGSSPARPHRPGLWARRHRGPAPGTTTAPPAGTVQSVACTVGETREKNCSLIVYRSQLALAKTFQIAN